MFTLTIPKPKLNPYSNRQYNADVYCACCGRGIPARERTVIVITEYIPGTPEDTHNFVKIEDYEGSTGPGYDPVAWGSFVGSHCAKRLPKEYKMTWKKCMKAWAKTGYQNT